MRTYRVMRHAEYCIDHTGEQAEGRSTVEPTCRTISPDHAPLLGGLLCRAATARGMPIAMPSAGDANAGGDHAVCAASPCYPLLPARGGCTASMLSPA